MLETASDFCPVAELAIKVNTAGTSALVFIVVQSTAVLSSASNAHKSNDASATQEKAQISCFCGGGRRRHGFGDKGLSGGYAGWIL